MFTFLLALSLNAECIPATAPHSENFDTLATAGIANANLPAGWAIAESGTSARNNGGYAASNGSDNSGDTYSFGSAGQAERALGTVRSGTFFASVSFCFLNNTGQSITALAIRYTGEMWRAGAANRTAADRLDFQYSLDGETWRNLDELDFSTPALSLSVDGPTNGNAPQFRAEKSATLAGIEVPDGAAFHVRWLDFDVAGADDGLAIDDFEITPLNIPALSIGDAAAPEGNAGSSAITFAVTLNQPAPAGGVQFLYRTADRSATAPEDYAAASGAAAIAEGETTATITILINGDTTFEADETFAVTISEPVGAIIARATAIGTIQNDDESPTGCAATHTIPQIQGTGSASRFAGQAVTIQAIVTARKLGSSGGYFLQSQGDNDPATSDALFVFTGAAAPPQAVPGNELCVRGTVVEFRPASDPFQPPLTQLTAATVLSTVATGQALPAPVELSIADTNPAGGLEVLERFEAMRVTIPMLQVTGPTGGNVSEINATANSNGVFFGVLYGTPRPLREPGIVLPDALPADAPATVPRFDGNPERIRVDSNAQPGTTPIEMVAGAFIGPLTGVLDYGFRTYTLLPDAGPRDTYNQWVSQPAPEPEPGEFTIASLNLERFFDDINAPGLGEPVLRPEAFERRLAKASLLIRGVLRSPDVIGVQEVEDLATLQRLADRLNADSGDNPAYAAYLEEGNDVGGIDAGFLVKSSRVTVLSVTQEGKTATYINPSNGQSETLNDRPPLILRAAIQDTPFTVIANHLRSLIDVDDATAGARVRAKRKAQAEYLASLIAARLAADPSENIVSLGDYNAFQFNDGFVDVIGTIKGTPAPPDQVTTASPDLLDPDLIDLIETLPPEEQYSYVFDGNAQVLDHILVNTNMFGRLSRFVQTHANADFPESYRGDASRPERLTDHDQPLAYFRLP